MILVFIQGSRKPRAGKKLHKTAPATSLAEEWIAQAQELDTTISH